MSAVPAPGAHGGDAARVAHALGLDPRSMVDLSASMNPFAPDVAEVIRELLRSDRGAIERYPDPARATTLLSQAIGVEATRVVLTNGGAEAIALVAAQLPIGDVVEPEFSLYRRHLITVEAGKPRWRSNPSNPLGTLAGLDENAAVWDEAFYPIATGNWTRGDEASWRLGSLTKLWNCPGLRLGYVIAPTPNDAALLRAAQPQWAVNGLALGVVPELLARTELVNWSAQITKLRSSFALALSNLGFVVRNTTVNWLLVDHPNLRTELAGHNIVVRDCTSFGVPGTFRVALPAPKDLDRVLAGFASITLEG